MGSYLKDIVLKKKDINIPKKISVSDEFYMGGVRKFGVRVKFEYRRPKVKQYG